MNQNFSIRPLALGNDPAESIVIAELRRLNHSVAFHFQQSVLPARATQLIGDELRPIAQRAMNSSRRAKHGGIVYIRPIPFRRRTLGLMRPGLIYLARRPQSAEARDLYSQRFEDNFLH